MNRQLVFFAVSLSDQIDLIYGIVNTVKIKIDHIRVLSNEEVDFFVDTFVTETCFCKKCVEETLVKIRKLHRLVMIADPQEMLTVGLGSWWEHLISDVFGHFKMVEEQNVPKGGSV